MHVRLHRQRHRGKEYVSVQICESYRDAAKGGAPRNRVLFNLGPIEKLGVDSLRKLADGFRRIAEGGTTEEAAVSLAEGRDFGHVHALEFAWKAIGIPEALDAADIAGGGRYPVAELVRGMVIYRVCDPRGRLGLFDWLEEVHSSGFLGRKPSYPRFLRALDRLATVKEKAELHLAGRLLKTFGRSSEEPVFYCIVSARYGRERPDGMEDQGTFGYGREHRFDRQRIAIGVALTEDGVPLCHHVFPGDSIGRGAVGGAIRDLKSRFGISRLIVAGGRGILSDENIGAALEEYCGYHVVHSLRFNARAAWMIGDLSSRFDRSSGTEQYVTKDRNYARFVLAYVPSAAKKARRLREKRLRDADLFLSAVLRWLEHPPRRGPKMTPQAAYTRIQGHLGEKGLRSFYNVSLSGGNLVVLPNRSARAWDEMTDGMTLIETTDMTGKPEDAFRRYLKLEEQVRGLLEIEDFPELRSHDLSSEGRIRANVYLRILALQVERWMERRLENVSVPEAIRILRRIKSVRLATPRKTVRMVTGADREQMEILRRLGVPFPPGTLPGNRNV